MFGVYGEREREKARGEKDGVKVVGPIPIIINYEV